MAMLADQAFSSTIFKKAFPKLFVRRFPAWSSAGRMGENRGAAFQKPFIVLPLVIVVVITNNWHW